MKKILVPTDFSTEADFALDAAAKIAAKTGASIELLHIVEIRYL
jgi:nucleotide-binding universal stress UspA family protein